MGSGGTCCFSPSPSTDQDGRGWRVVGCRETWHGGHRDGNVVGRGERCPSHPSKSMLGLSGSKALPSDPTTEHPMGSGFLLAPSSSCREGKGSEGTDWGEMLPARKASQERSYQAQGDACFTFTLLGGAAGTQGRGAWDRDHPLGRATALPSSINREALPLGALLAGRGIAWALWLVKQ